MECDALYKASCKIMNLIILQSVHCIVMDDFLVTHGGINMTSGVE